MTSPVINPPRGWIEPHKMLLEQPSPGQRLYKVMSVENLLRSVAGSYLHFQRVDQYRDFPGADSEDGAEPAGAKATSVKVGFQKSPNYSLSDYYDSVRRRTYACCFSLENSEYIWDNYGGNTDLGKICLEFVYEKLRERLNATMSGPSTLMYGDIQCHQIFSINYGKIVYVDRGVHNPIGDVFPNPIIYTYLKDRETYNKENELRISLSALGLGRPVLNDGQEMNFSPTLSVEFDFRKAIIDGTITQILTGPMTNLENLKAKFTELGIGSI